MRRGASARARARAGAWGCWCTGAGELRLLSCCENSSKSFETVNEIHSSFLVLTESPQLSARGKSSAGLRPCMMAWPGLRNSLPKKHSLEGPQKGGCASTYCAVVRRPQYACHTFPCPGRTPSERLGSQLAQQVPRWTVANRAESIIDDGSRAGDGTPAAARAAVGHRRHRPDGARHGRASLGTNVPDEPFHRAPRASELPTSSRQFV